jgi:glycopeptide antibiotics resistance protein
MRWSLFALLALYCAALLYGTLHPFNFGLKRMHTAGSAHNRIEWIPFTYACPEHGAWCFRDKGRNLVLFVPVGLLVAVTRRHRASRLGRIGFATGLGFLLSLAVETAQCFLPSRFPSTTDLLMNTLGTCLGAVLAVALLAREKRAES